MADPRPESVLGHLNHLLCSAATTADDGRLLERFVHNRDESAFAELVARHGPLVMGLCRRLLGNRQDAEDVFQATFFVLARKAATIRKPESLSCWLHGVAARLALKARAEAERRRCQERQAAPVLESAEVDLPWREVRGLLDEELQRLPEKQRLPLVLCYLEGLTQDEASRRLGWPRGTLKRRLEAGRERLRLRLTRRGVTLGAGLFATALTESTSRAAIPVTLRTATVGASIQFLSNESAAVSSTSAAQLAQGALQAMLTNKLKLGAMLFVLFGCVGAAAGLAVLRDESEPPVLPSTIEEERPSETKLVRKDNYGDPLPEKATVRLGTVRMRQAGGISPVLFTRDGKTVIVGDGDGNLVYWDVATGKEVRRLAKAVLNWPCQLAITADGKTLAAVDRMGMLFLFEIATCKLLSKSEAPIFPFGQILFAPDGRMLALSSGASIILWDAAHQKKLHELKGHSGRVQCMAFSPDGETLASSGESDPHIRLWNVASGTEKLHIADGQSIELSLAFRPDGKTLAAIGDAAPLSFFDPNTGKKMHTATENYVGLSKIQYAPDGKTLAGIERWGSVCILDAASGRRLRTFEAPPRAMNGLAFSSDGKTLATFWSVLPSLSAHTFDLWDTASGKLLHSFAGHREGVSGLAFAADGKTLFSVAGLSDASLLAWDATTGGLRDQHGEFGKGYHGLSLSPDGKLLAVCGDRSLEVWDAASRKKLHDCESLNFSWHYPGVSVAWSADCRLLVSSGHMDRNVRVWDAITGKQRGAIAANQEYPAGVALSPDGAVVAVGGYRDGTIRMWSVASGKELRKLATPSRELQGDFVRPGRTRIASMVSALAFHPDGAILASGGLEGDLNLWDAATGRLLRRWETKAGWIRQLAISRDGRTLITGHSDRATDDASRVYLWEGATGQQRACYSGHRGPILSVAFAPDDRRVASGSEDTTILIWATTGETRRDAELSAEQLRSLWDALIGTDADRAYRSIWRLALTPKHSLPFLSEQLRRIARLEEEYRNNLPRLIEDLDDERFSVREKAERELEKMGSLVEPALRQALEGKPSLEMRRRMESVLEKTTGRSGERLRALRALEAIEHMNAPEARQLVEALAKGEPHAWLSVEARAIQKRLAEQSVATPQR